MTHSMHQACGMAAHGDHYQHICVIGLDTQTYQAFAVRHMPCHALLTLSAVTCTQARSEEEAASMQSELEFTRLEMERAQHQIVTLEHQRQGLEVAHTLPNASATLAPCRQGLGLGLKSKPVSARMLP